MTRTKICCMKTLDDAQLAIRAGASAVGLVSEMPSGPGMIPESLIAEIARSVPPPIGRFLLTSQKDPQKIVGQHARCGVNTIQICDRLPLGGIETLRESLPGVSLVQVVHVINEESVAEALDFARLVDALLLDSGNPSLAVKELGGTGRTHDWSISAQIVAQADIPVFLAGGLNPENVGAAIERVRPFGVDVCSGVRTDGKLDEAKLVQFLAAVRTADLGTAEHDEQGHFD